MSYYLNLFSPETWDSCEKEGFSVSGFSPNQRSTAQKIKPGDVLICYLVGLSRWCGALRVTSEAYDDDKPIFADPDPYTVRFKVDPIYAFPPEQSVPIFLDEIWSNLSLTRDMQKGVSGWATGFRGSLRSLLDEDGKLLMKNLSVQEVQRELYPLDVRDKRQLARRASIQSSEPKPLPSWRLENNMSALFSTLSFQLGQLVTMIDDGSIGLPEIQRPFVWKKTKVRDLFDSMYRGFPVGYFLFWRNSSAGAKQIGTATHQLPTERMIVDGQQRLTSLYAVLKGVPVIDESYRATKIEIAFNPLEGAFAVTSAVHRRSPQWIPDISVLWDDQAGLFSLVGDFIERLRQETEVSADQQRVVENRVQQLYKLSSYNFTAIELSADTDPEAVADIFVRINSAGVELNQADFILTLMSVYWDEGRKELEAFCREAKVPSPGSPSPFNHFLDPSPAELLRVTVGYGFRRGRLRSVYNLLRGKEVDGTGVSGTGSSWSIGLTLKARQGRVRPLRNCERAALYARNMSGIETSNPEGLSCSFGR